MRGANRAVFGVQQSTHAQAERLGWRLSATTTFAAVGVVLAWFTIQLARFIGEPPDLDAMIALRESIIFYRGGLGALIEKAGPGVHPPLLEVLTSAAFTVFGEYPSSQQLIAILLFAVVAAATERLLAPWLAASQRVTAALTVAICPSLAIALFVVSREGLLMAALMGALALALAPGELTRGRIVALGCVAALLPLAKETGLVLIAPFAVYVAITGPRPWARRLWRGGIVAAIPLGAALAWSVVLRRAGGTAWHAWIASTQPGDTPYLAALRAMFGLENSIYLKQNLANGLVVNYLWLPAALALVTVALLARRTAPTELRRAAALVGGLAAIYAWTVLPFPTFTIPRYSAPLSLLVILLVLLGLSQWPRAARPAVLASLLAAFAAGAWSPTDPVSRMLFGTVSVGGERIYDTPQRERGPDRMVINFAVLRAGARMNDRLRRVYASDADLVAGDCEVMKLGEKLYSIGSAPTVYDRSLPGARPIRCVRVEELPADAANGTRKIALVRPIEDLASGQRPPISGASVIVIP